jgi:hypothetical protein
MDNFCLVPTKNILFRDILHWTQFSLLTSAAITELRWERWWAETGGRIPRISSMWYFVYLCPEISSIDWAQTRRLHLTTETESSPELCAFLNKIGQSIMYRNTLLNGQYHLSQSAR